MTSADDEVLAEMLREAERTIDQQRRASEEQDDRTEQALTLTVATLGGGLALATVTLGNALADRWFVFALSAAAVSNLLALGVLLRAYLAMPRLEHAGPSLDWLGEKSEDADWSLRDHLMSVLAGHAANFDRNGESLRITGQVQLEAMGLLTGALAAYALAMLYILGRSLVG